MDEVGGGRCPRDARVGRGVLGRVVLDDERAALGAEHGLDLADEALEPREAVGGGPVPLVLDRVRQVGERARARREAEAREQLGAGPGPRRGVERVVARRAGDRDRRGRGAAGDEVVATALAPRADPGRTPGAVGVAAGHREPDALLQEHDRPVGERAEEAVVRERGVVGHDDDAGIADQPPGRGDEDRGEATPDQAADTAAAGAVAEPGAHLRVAPEVDRDHGPDREVGVAGRPEATKLGERHQVDVQPLAAEDARDRRHHVEVMARVGEDEADGRHAGRGYTTGMRAWGLAAVIAVGCSFPATGGGDDGDDVIIEPDAGRTDAAPVDRITDGLIGLWLLAENGGATVGETSGLTPAIAPMILDPTRVVWSPGALEVTAPVDINTGFRNVPNRLLVACRDSDEVTLEAWVTPSRLDQTGTSMNQPARIATITVQNIGGHQISLGQLGTTWAAQAKTTNPAIDMHGGPILRNGTVASALTHLSVTASPTGRRFYVDGVLVEDTLGGPLDWGTTMRTFQLAGDPNRRNTWLGTLHLVAMYDRALSADEISTNHRAGP